MPEYASDSGLVCPCQRSRCRALLWHRHNVRRHRFTSVSLNTALPHRSLSLRIARRHVFMSRRVTDMDTVTQLATLTDTDTDTTVAAITAMAMVIAGKFVA